MKQRRNNVTGVTWEDIKYKKSFQSDKTYPKPSHFWYFFRENTHEIDPWNFRETVGHCGHQNSSRVRDKWTQETYKAV